MAIVSDQSVQKTLSNLGASNAYPTQFEFLPMSERMRRLKLRLKNLQVQIYGKSTKPERCAMLYFSVPAHRVTETRHLIISICEDKLIFMRIKPMQHATQMQVELFVKASVMQQVKEVMKNTFPSQAVLK